MRCFYHNNIDAVGTCSKCQKGVCRACVEDVGGALLCKDCRHLVREEIAEQSQQDAAPLRKALRRSHILAGVGFVWGLIGGIAQFQNFPNAAVGVIFVIAGPMLMAYFLWAWYLGYRGLKRIQPNVFLILPIFGWVIYFTIKSVIGGTYGFWGGGIYEYLKIRRQLAAIESEAVRHFDRYCTSCGQLLEAGANFCIGCGVAVAKTDQISGGLGKAMAAAVDGRTGIDYRS